MPQQLFEGTATKINKENGRNAEQFRRPPERLPVRGSIKDAQTVRSFFDHVSFTDDPESALQRLAQHSFNTKKDQQPQVGKETNQDREGKVINIASHPKFQRVSTINPKQTATENTQNVFDIRTKKKINEEVVSKAKKLTGMETDEIQKAVAAVDQDQLYNFTPEQMLAKDLEVAKGKLEISQDNFKTLATALMAGIGGNKEKDEEEEMSLMMILFYIVALFMKAATSEEGEVTPKKNNGK